MTTGLPSLSVNDDELDGWTLERPNPAAKKHNNTHSTNNDMSVSGSANSPQHAADVRFSCNICFDAVTEPVVTACGHLYCWPCLFQWLEPGLLPHERVSLGILPQHPFQQPSSSHDASKRVCPVCKAPCSVQRIVPIYVRGNATSTRDKSRNNSVENETENGINESDNGGVELRDQDISDMEDEPEQEQDNMGVRSTTGLRLRFRSTDSHIPNNNDHHSGSPTVPRRPAPHSPLRNSDEFDTLNHSTSSSPLRHHAGNMSTMSPGLPRGPHPASLSHGMLPLMQHALLRASSDHATGGAPPLSRLEHSRRGGDDVIDLDSAPDTTEFLSRLLLLLGSFVIFCLLLF